MAADGSVIIEILGDAQDVTDKIKGVANGAVKMLTTAITAAGTALAGVSAAAIKVGAEFEQSMSQVAATMGLSVEEIRNGSEEFTILQNAAKEAGASTAFSASQAAEALNYLALAGYDAATSAEVLPSVLNLAAAGGMELAYASDLATDAMAALGIEANKANLEQFGDQLAAAANNANASVSQLGEAILVVGGTAKGLAGGTTELNAALGVLANRGIKGAEGGTALRNIILALSAPTDKAADAIERLNVAVYDAEGNMRPLNDVFQDLNESMENMTEGEKTEVLNEIFNKVDLKSAQALLAGTGEEFDALAAAIENSQGAMENMASVQLDNLNGDITILKSGLEGLGIALYETMQVNARDAVQSITGAVGAISEALTNGGISEAIQVAGQQIGSIAASVAMEIPNFLLAGASLLQAIVSGILQALPQLQATAGELFASFISYLQENLPQLISAGLQALLSFSQGFRESVGSLVDAAIGLVMTLADGVIEALPELIATVPEIISNFANAINDNAPKLLFAAAELIAKLVQGIIENIPVLIANAPKIALAIWDVITAFNWVNLGANIVKGIINGVKSLFSSVTTTAQTLVQNWRVVLSDLPGYFKAIGQDMIQGLINGIKSMAVAVVDNIKSIGTSAVSGLKSILGIHSPSRVMRDEVGQMIGEGIAEGIEDSTPDALNSAESFADDLTNALKMDALEGLDISGITKQLRNAVEAEAARLSADLTISSNAPAEARAARDRSNAAQNAAANAAYTEDRRNEKFSLYIGGKEFWRGSLEDLRAVEDENPRTLDDT